MTKKDALIYWQKVAQEDLETATTLVKAKRYHHGLFFCHLALEKLIKGLVYKNTNKHPLPIHDLYKLALQAKISISDDLFKDLEEINSWNIKARYDNIKREFYKKATEKFTLAWFKKIKELFKWLKNQY